MLAKVFIQNRNGETWPEKITRDEELGNLYA